MLAPLLAAVVALTAPHLGHLEARAQLGHGYTALVYRRIPPHEIGPLRWTFEVRRDGRLVRLWRTEDEAMPLHVRDITGDGIRDVLVVDYIGGSGGCENYRLYGGPRLGVLWHLRDACEDTTRVELVPHGIDSWHAIYSSQTKATRGSIHCCWRRWRQKEWRWSRGGLRLARRTVTTHPPPIDPNG